MGLLLVQKTPECRQNGRSKECDLASSKAWMRLSSAIQISKPPSRASMALCSLLP